MRDLEFLRDDENAPIAYDEARKGFRLTDVAFALPPVQLSRREVFSFCIARKLLERIERKELTRRVLSWMPHVRVLAPQELRERVRQRMRLGLACSR